MKFDPSLLENTNKQGAVKEPVKESVKEPVKEPAEEPIKESVKETVKEQVEAKKPTKKRGSKILTFFLVLLMLIGFGVFVFNMVHLVNNMRLENQGNAVQDVDYEAGDRIDEFIDMADSGSVTVDEDSEDLPETNVPLSAPEYTNESDALAAMRQEVDDARNHAAMKEQELRNAEEMLDASLQREAELQQTIEKLENED